MTSVHEKTLTPQPPKDDGHVMDALTFEAGVGFPNPMSCVRPKATRFMMALLLVASIALYAAGATADLVSFTSTYVGEEASCIRSYTLYSLGSTIVSDFFMYKNEAKVGVWILYTGYICFVAVIPILVHCVHVMALIFNVKFEILCHVTNILWTFASVEVLLIGVYTVHVSLSCRKPLWSHTRVQYKFDAIVSRLAGDEGAQFFAVDSILGSGFYLLIVYSFCGGLLHYLYSSATADYFGTTPHYKAESLFTAVFGGLGLLQAEETIEEEPTRATKETRPTSPYSFEDMSEVNL